MFSKAIVTLKSFENELQQYLEKNQENWKRKIFLMFDDTRSEVGQIDLSISLTKKRRSTFNAMPRNDFENFSSALPQSPKGAMQPSYNSYFNGIPNITRGRTQELNEGANYGRPNTNDGLMRERPRTGSYEDENRQLKGTTYHNEQFNDGQGDNVYDNNFKTRNIPKDTFKALESKGQDFDDKRTIGKNNKQGIEDKILFGNEITLKTIVEGHYCPPIMILQKVSRMAYYYSYFLEEKSR